MDNATYIPLSLATALRRDMDVTANNIANANTVGFKRERVAFESYLHDDTTDAGETLNFVVDGGSYIDLAQGTMQRTDNPLDLALDGAGWFAFQTPDGGTAVGRDGRLTLDPEGTLVNVDGAPILDQGGGVINLPPEAAVGLAIARDGTMTGPDGAVLGRIGVFTVPDLQAYQRIGGGLLQAPEGVALAAPVADPTTNVIQGTLEGSNVQPILEMTRMMEIQRAYDRAQTLTSTADELRRDALSRLSQPAT